MMADIVYARLLEYGSNYYDVRTFSDGETKRALQRAHNKARPSRNGTSVEARPTKKKK